MLRKSSYLQFWHLHNYNFDTVLVSSYKRVCTSLMPQSDVHIGNTWAELRHFVPNQFLLFSAVPLWDFTVPKWTSKILQTTTLQRQVSRLTLIPLIYLGLFKLNWLLLPWSSDTTMVALLAVLWQNYHPAEKRRLLETLPARSERAHLSLPSLWAAYRRRQENSNFFVTVYFAPLFFQQLTLIFTDLLQLHL